MSQAAGSSSTRRLLFVTHLFHSTEGVPALWDTPRPQVLSGRLRRGEKRVPEYSFGW
jgi:hypothetical protein